MPRSPLALAALATVAIPGLDAFDVRRPRDAGSDVDTAVVIDATRHRWIVRAPVSPAAGAALEAEVGLLELLAAHVDAGALPFGVPRVAGFAHLPEGGRAVVHAELPGRPLRLETLPPGPGLAASLGRALAALHELPTSVVENAGLPAYDAEAYRQRRMAEVDEAARTGHVPVRLLRRWEAALENVAVWRFRPTVVHGDLTVENVLVADGGVSAILGWGETKVADPADDLAWLMVAAPHDAAESVMEAYQLRRTELLDPHLTERAYLAGELALARWLLYGVRSNDDEIVADAVQMLDDLDASSASDDADDTADADEGDGPELVRASAFERHAGEDVPRFSFRDTF